jgi:hypothetical protein
LFIVYIGENCSSNTNAEVGNTTVAGGKAYMSEVLKEEILASN